MLRKVAEGVHVHASECIETNTTVVEGDEGVLLVDPGLTRAEVACLAGDLRGLGEAGLPVVAGFATHPDWDHALWDAGLGPAPRYGTARAVEALRSLRARPDWLAEFEESLPPEIAGEVPTELFGLLEPLPAGADSVPWAGPRAGVLQHDGHAPGHAALLVAGRGVLVAGDLVSDVLVPMPSLRGDAADPLGDYLAGLDLLEQAAASAEVTAFVPGHGSPGDAAELRARIALDRAYIEALRDGLAIADPRVDAPKPGWEWVADVHEGNAAAVAARR
ncbi:MBL fold metallo-hydrolase [Homoserinibacter sp. YIM 151385]|uniref:MBL fold metallo-hydrolase n=1 Tax=Homoserinibacter sp. YIM 151385 TaxID=2985506 RepID=UPI0022EFE964|nr:MBL fold metallo-hydrolase [Homoserinibacter sp. YIM 151385]WBU36728.1 MBL fold metallo-hydrolase [Homoserinibacter sp. YIM 151385]